MKFRRGSGFDFLRDFLLNYTSETLQKCLAVICFGFADFRFASI
jgi:hypothetical protein